jgi:hypothetical protein
MHNPLVPSGIQQPARSAVLMGCAALASLLALAGCASMKVRLGWRVSLDKTPVASIQASLPKGPGIAPGEKSALVVVLTAPDGKVLQTEGKGHGKVLWRDLKVTATIVTANEKGIVFLSSDPIVSDGKLPHVTITMPSHPDIHAELDIPVRYDHDFIANFSGGRGNSGTSGFKGTDGTNGRTGSIDPTNPSAGGDGTSGSNGSDGSDGGRGDDAPPMQVRVAFRDGSRPVLQIAVSATGREEQLYLVDPQGGSLTVKAEGGSGGSGGSGGCGGRGGSGGSGTPSGHSGSDGSDGRSGSDGPPGRGGSITVTYDPQAQPYLSRLRLSNRGGPTPVFKEEPVKALW